MFIFFAYPLSVNNPYNTIRAGIQTTIQKNKQKEKDEYHKNFREKKYDIEPN
jgi:hypothetical protein